VLLPRDGRPTAFFQYLMSEDELRREVEAVGFKVIESGSVPQAHINHVAPRLAPRLPGLVHRAANLAAQALSWSPRYRVMIYTVARKA